MKIATWNVNSVKVRLPLVLEFLAEAKPDVLLMQEIKTEEATFPALEFENIGYKLAISGQKSYNGVAIASKIPFKVTNNQLPFDDTDEQARYIEAELENGHIVASLYVPNGNPSDGEVIGSDKFNYKLAWFDRLKQHTKELLDTGKPVILGGDYNIIPNDEDVYSAKAFADNALINLPARKKFRELLNLGLTEIYGSTHPKHKDYTFWDYQGGAWQKDMGMRIDHFLLSPKAVDKHIRSYVDKAPRAKPQPSDHTPLVLEIKG